MLHPQPDELQAWNRGELPAHLVADLEAHVEDCADCAAMLAAELGAADPLVSELRAALRNDRPSNRLASEAPGALLGGRFKLVERIGDGGMGTVWMAQQVEPVRRMVAVKLIKAGMDSAAVLARFEAERQALALMDHPNIAKVLDAGMLHGADGNRPYVIMELVKGMPITRFCDDRKLTPRERLELFIPVCQAIQHAHQKGIIHRDIKPSNVLVALYDDHPVPKIIDFGVAKAVGQPLTERTLHTGFGSVVGTPEYMSPEQASFNNLDVDTRSDVYSLGVMLYELLTGTPPHSQTNLEQAGLLEVLRVVREEDPPRPSHRLSTTEALARLAEARGTDASRLPRIVRGELDWIVMKCLEKDRNRRYETANGLAEDLRRYVAGEPVRAVPPSTAYRLRKLVGKYRGPIMAAGLLAVALAVGICGTTIGLVRAIKAEATAVAHAAATDVERGKAVEAVQAEQKAKENAQDSLRHVSRAHGDLIWLIMRTSTQLKNHEVEGTLKTLIDEIGSIAATLDQKEIGDAGLRCEMRLSLGRALRLLEQFPVAAAQLDKGLAEAETSFGPHSPQTIAALVEYAMLERLMGRPDSSERYRLRARQAFAKLMAAPNVNTAARIELMQYLREWTDETALAVQLAEQFVKEARDNQPYDEWSFVGALHQLAWAQLRSQRFDVAASQQADVLKRLQALGARVNDRQRLSMAWDAHTLFQQTAQIDGASFAFLQQAIGADQIATGLLAARGARLLQEKDWIGAEAILRQCLARREKEEADSWTTYNTQSMLGAAIMGQSRPAEAKPLLIAGLEGLKLRQAKMPKGAQTRVAEAATRLAEFCELSGQADEAANWRAEAARIAADNGR